MKGPLLVHLAGDVWINPEVFGGIIPCEEQPEFCDIIVGNARVHVDLSSKDVANKLREATKA